MQAVSMDSSYRRPRRRRLARAEEGMPKAASGAGSRWAGRTTAVGAGAAALRVRGLASTGRPGLGTGRVSIDAS